ncbi:MAG: UDP-N-acetylglucosamine 2-epimerase (non-hydrolyzing) [Proteobacteria bacterium]|nr:UDP-N-acetylglucosamine 2-epimerase (non-hydrolyzing) [Pseudomonadota bacterium]
MVSPPMRVLCIVGARPNFMKMAPALRALRTYRELTVTLVHTGQHYDAEMSESFFEQLGVPQPDHRLEVGSATHAVQTARVMERLEPLLMELTPDVVVVCGDVNSTLAAALAASKLHIPVAHIEAGLRSYDRRMPEEINRVLVDQISEILYTTEKSAKANLQREGIDEDKVVFVGNLMIDSLHAALPHAVPAAEQVERRFGREALPRLSGGYAVLTLHRPSNVDEPKTFAGILDAVETISSECPVIFPVHPRTAGRIADLGRTLPKVLMTTPVSYREMVGLIRDARLVLTDSGGLQEETTALGVPCLTLRENTERPITVEEGTNRVVGTDPARIVEEARAAMGGRKAGRVPEGWDGAAAQRLAAHLLGWLRARKALA